MAGNLAEVLPSIVPDADSLEKGDFPTEILSSVNLVLGTEISHDGEGNSGRNSLYSIPPEGGAVEVCTFDSLPSAIRGVIKALENSKIETLEYRQAAAHFWSNPYRPRLKAVQRK